MHAHLPSEPSPSRPAASTETGRQAAAELYRQANAYRRRQMWAEALNAYEQAERLDPSSPARAARQMLADIMEFRCKAYFNP